ncbi:MAG: hypothetical protein QXP38_04930 [Nitrososphaerota archaeon]
MLDNIKKIINQEVMRPLLKDLFNNDTDQGVRAKYDKTFIMEANRCEYVIPFDKDRNKKLGNVSNDIIPSKILKNYLYNATKISKFR